ncbi:hypothetical protein KY389_14815 [Paracoccus bogoriensis]|uniref:hypothetical protein n=1 Tax=Paracoccus bogoriensis TaxID=242065 RepID=UPI001CA4A92B|nr:hypothetical protein [Paracoccus bogoriensis]MBW7057926.1 hypothetical protein [Paracoccus bogoriensis]
MNGQDSWGQVSGGARNKVVPAQLRARLRQGDNQLEQIDAALARLGNSEIAATSSIHQEVLRELKQINTCFVMVAYPILTESGDLLETRLRRAEA